MSHTILLVDDEHNFWNALEKIVRRQNYNVLRGGTGSEALKILSQNRIDLAIADYMLPDMNGFELLKMMKTSYPETIRIMLTGKPDLGLITMVGKDMDILQGYITKPCDIDVLKNKLSMFLFRSNTVSAPEGASIGK